MGLTIDDLNNNDIYLEDKDTLARRIDFAWSVYSDDNKKYQATVREAALKFLIYAFDISDPKNVNEQLILLMEERDAHKNVNPDYIPGKSPTRIPFDPRSVVPKQTQEYGKSGIPEIDKAIQTKELLDVTMTSKSLDREEETIFLTIEERAAQRVNISGGQFKKHGMLFDTSQMHSHNKVGFAAFTLNANGEFSVFSHNRMADRVAHSSMNAGSPVVAAGEIKVENGVLKAITTHSGHYQPSLFNVYRLLEYFSRNNVDISQAKIITFTNPSESLSGVQSQAVYYDAYHHTMYETPAAEIYTGLNNLIKENIGSISAQVKSYKEGGVLSSLYQLKDALMGSNLTEQRALLASELETEINIFKIGLVDTLTYRELKNKINELESIISKFQDKNQDLSSSYNKKESSGRLTTKLTEFKERLDELKAEEQGDEKKTDVSTSMKNIS